jgi:hypothetical protein
VPVTQWEIDHKTTFRSGLPGLLANGIRTQQPFLVYRVDIAGGAVSRVWACEQIICGEMGVVEVMSGQVDKWMLWTQTTSRCPVDIIGLPGICSSLYLFRLLRAPRSSSYRPVLRHALALGCGLLIAAQ